MVTILALGLGLFVAPLVAGFLASVYARRSVGARAALAVTGVVAAAYVALVGYEAAWALADWDGSVQGDNVLHPLGLDNEDTRQEFLRLTAMIFAIPAVMAVVGAWGVEVLERAGLAGRAG